jgi:hypothetical protein
MDREEFKKDDYRYMIDYLREHNHGIYFSDNNKKKCWDELLYSNLSYQQIFTAIVCFEPIDGEKSMLFYYLRNNGHIDGIMLFREYKGNFYHQYPMLLTKSGVALQEIENRLLKIEQYQANILDKLTVLAEIIDKK